MAVNVIVAPAQIVFVPEVGAIVNEGVSCPVTVIVIVFELAVAGFAQLELEVSTHATASLFAKLDDV